MKFGELKNRAIVSVADARKLGYVDSLLLDLAHQRILGLRVRSGGLLTHHEAILLQDVQSVGHDAVTVQDASKLNAESKFSELHGSTEVTQLIGARVLNENGRELGTIADVDVDLDGATVSGYLLGANLIDRVRRHEHVVSPSAIRSFGDKLIVVSNEVAVD